MKESLFLSFVHMKYSQNATTEEVQALQEVKVSLEALQQGDFSNIPSILKEFGEYVEAEVVRIVDAIPIKFYVIDEDKKVAVLDAVITEQTLFHRTLRKYIMTASYEEVQKLLADVMQGVAGKNVVVFQSVRECDQEMKQDIRGTLGEVGFTKFQINQSILGGFRLYKNEKLLDASWLGKILSLKNMSN